MSRIADREQAHAAALRLAAAREALAQVRQDEHDRAVLYARTLRNCAELMRRAGDKPGNAILELAGAASIGQARAHTRLEHGRRMVDLYALALELLDAGALLCGTVEMLLWMTAKAPEHVQEELGRRISGQLVGLDAQDARTLIAASLVEVEAELEAQEQKERHQQAQANRGVWIRPAEDGMVRIGAEVDEISAQRFALDLEELVRAQKLLDDETGRQRTQQQRRADVLAELPSRHLELLRALQKCRSLADLVPAPRLSPEDEAPDAWSQERVAAELFALPVRNPVTMYVHIPMSTLLDVDHRSGYVEGLGAVSAYRGRLLRPTASLQRLWVDQRTGVPLGIDPDPPEPPIGEPDWTDPEQVAATALTVRNRLLSMLRPTGIGDRPDPGRAPSRATKRFVQVRDLSCVGPGCPMPASRCELDHDDEWASGGLTASWNLDLKSKRCHHCRHDGWDVRRSEDGGTTWISPLGSKVYRRSRWRPPPPGPTGELPEPTLDLPDGGKSRSDWYADPALDRSLDARLNRSRPDPSRADRGPLLQDEIARIKHQLRVHDERAQERPLGRGWDPPPF